MINKDVQDSEIQRAKLVEVSRIEFLLQRDGAATTIIWVRRTLAIYRRAVLDQRHFAQSEKYRRKFVASCLVFRGWLASNGGYGR